ncbi:hypothetical protein BDZ45DRAFT_694096 [Acephala macrosclerotiorum]|nr:hypothetical protein BDZ45DRAFT_694096 [Acephala macrosclerotiorum]
MSCGRAVVRDEADTRIWTSNLQVIKSINTNAVNTIESRKKRSGGTQQEIQKRSPSAVHNDVVCTAVLEFSREVVEGRKYSCHRSYVIPGATCMLARLSRVQIGDWSAHVSDRGGKRRLEVFRSGQGTRNYFYIAVSTSRIAEYRPMPAGGWGGVAGLEATGRQTMGRGHGMAATTVDGRRCSFDTPKVFPRPNHRPRIQRYPAN